MIDLAEIGGQCRPGPGRGLRSFVRAVRLTCSEGGVSLFCALT
jgi:hypothetical protein